MPLRDARPPGSLWVSTREEIISEIQRPFRLHGSSPMKPCEYRRMARWLELEAMRCYPSSLRSLQYAAAQRWFAELAAEYGDGHAPELLRRSGNKMPEFS